MYSENNSTYSSYSSNRLVNRILKYEAHMAIILSIFEGKNLRV